MHIAACRGPALTSAVLFRREPRPAVPAGPVLVAQASTGERYEDPSEDLLFELLADLASERDYVMVERLADTTGQTYAQAMRTDRGYLVERRDGSEDTHAHAVTADLSKAHEDLTTWAFGLDRPYTLPWAAGYGG